LKLLRASVLNFERVDILRDSIEHPSKRLLSFEFATSFRFQFGASRLNLLRASIFNLENLDILRDSIEHPSIKLLFFEIAQSLCSQFGASRYMTVLNRTSE